MMLLAITAQTWFITGLGFGMVVLLLFAFVFVMKFMGWVMQPRVKAKKVENKPAEQTVTHTESKLSDTITLTDRKSTRLNSSHA